MMIMEKKTMNVNKMSMDSDLHSEQLIEAITLIKNNESFFVVEQDIASNALKSDWNVCTSNRVLAFINKRFIYDYINGSSLTYILNDEEYLQNESEKLIELGEEIRDYNSHFAELNDEEFLQYKSKKLIELGEEIKDFNSFVAELNF